MKRNEAYLKACMAKEVPVSVLVKNAKDLEGKSERVQDELREKWAMEIMAKYPNKKKM